MLKDNTNIYNAQHSILGTALFYIAVVCSVLSNFPAVLGTGLEIVLKVMWALPFFWLFVVKDTRMLWTKELLPFYSLIVVFFLYCVLLQSMFGVQYVGADFYNIVISSLVAITSYAYWRDNASERTLEHLAYLLLACGLLLGLYTYFTWLRGG